MEFVDAIIPPDSVPETSDVEIACEVCGREAGPYAGRGRRPTRCPDHKKGASKSGVKASAASTNLAADATKVLSQLNGLIALGLSAAGLFGTASAIAENNSLFEQRAMAALSTDKELCRMILKTGVKSARINLAIAYAGLGVAVLPSAVNEIREKKAERDARREAEADEAGTEYATATI